MAGFVLHFNEVLPFFVQRYQSVQPMLIQDHEGVLIVVVHHKLSASKLHSIPVSFTFIQIFPLSPQIVILFPLQPVGASARHLGLSFNLVSWKLLFFPLNSALRKAFLWRRTQGTAYFRLADLDEVAFQLPYTSVAECRAAMCIIYVGCAHAPHCVWGNRNRISPRCCPPTDKTLTINMSQGQCLMTSAYSFAS